VESSITKQFSFGKPEASVALINISGCGLEAFKSAPLNLA
jgi:hypothetical protein